MRLESFVLGFLAFDFPDSWFQGIDDTLGLLGGVGKELFGLLVLGLQGKRFQAGWALFKLDKVCLI